MPARALPIVVVALLGLFLGGCGGESDLDVAAGQYRLHVEGAVADTLAGAAVLRPLQAGRTGVELGERDGPGLSMELTSPPRSDRRTAAAPTRLSRGRYPVVTGTLLDAPSSVSDSLVGVRAFLSLGNATFVATQGHLSVTHAADGRLEGTLDLEMRERTRTVTAPRTVRVTGALRATTP